MCSNGYEKKPGIPNVGVISVGDDVANTLGADNWVAKGYRYLYDPIVSNVVVDDIEAFCSAGPVDPPGNYNAVDFVIGLGGILKSQQWAQHNKFNEWCQCRSSPLQGGQCPDPYHAELTVQFYYGGDTLGLGPRTSSSTFPGPWTYPVIETFTQSSGRVTTVATATYNGGQGQFTISGGNDADSAEIISFTLTPVNHDDSCGDPPLDELPPPAPPPTVDPGDTPAFDFPADDASDYRPPSSSCVDISVNPITFTDAENPDPEFTATKGAGCSYVFDLKLDMCNLQPVLDAIAALADSGTGGPGLTDSNEDGRPDIEDPINGDPADENDGWPIVLPELLTQENETTTTINSIPQSIAWLARNLDAITGQYPIKIELKDTDPLAPGDQAQIISLPNQSEAMAELFGLAYEANTNSELAINILFRLVPEIIAAKNSSLTAQDYTQAITNWLGFRTKNKERKVDSNFNPLRAESLPEFLQNSQYEIQGVEDIDPHTLVEWIQQIKYATAILKASVFRGAGQEENLVEELTAVAEGQPPEESGELWEKFIDALNRQNSNLTDQTLYPRPRATSVEDVLSPGTVLPDREAD
ncbi:MAG: hypothetical protein AAFY54_01840 [Cyanobacteria bacterium J06648_10]